MERILILGTSGMLGNAVFRFFTAHSDHLVHGTTRSRAIGDSAAGSLLGGVDVANFDTVIDAFRRVRPTVVINCVGVVKQLEQSRDPLHVLPINSLLPHRLALLCAASGSRLVHVSTDCVFSGKSGSYREDDHADADDLYGRSKYLGEVGGPHAVTLRTSIIGHELATSHGLVDWFLAQSGPVKGFTRAIFSGLPTVALAEVIRDHVLPDAGLTGIYHVSSAPISKFALLGIIAQVYGRSTVITPDDQLTIDRSLDASRFRERTGYQPAEWPELVRQMHSFG